MRGRRVWTLLLWGFGVLNALLYSGMMPLWEGFDEPFHFGYVQHLANGWGVPDARTARLSREVADSLRLAPGSLAVKQNLPVVRTYEEYFGLPADKQLAIRAELYQSPGDRRWSGSPFLNYEAHHPPLAYALMAMVERALEGMALPWRVLVLRVLVAIAGTLLLFAGMRRLMSALEVGEGFDDAAVLCVLMCQMTTATMAHVANDWLAVPLSVWLLVVMIGAWRGPGMVAGAKVGGVLAMGLLTKAYFLAFLPLVVVGCLLLRAWRMWLVITGMVALIAGPWYLRNWLHYGVISGMQEGRAAISVGLMMSTAMQLDWPRLVLVNARRALWTGNNLFLAFSTKTLNVILTVLASCVLMGLARGRHRVAGWVTAGHCATFATALAYSTVISTIYTQGVADGPSPWYSQVVMGPLIAVGMLGCSRMGRVGQWLGSGLVGVFGYVLVVGYWGKLIPAYAGYVDRAAVGVLFERYGEDWWTMVGRLDLVMLAPAGVMLWLAGLVSLMGIGLSLRLALMGGSRVRKREASHSCGVF
jgi:hypothetical protein